MAAGPGASGIVRGSRCVIVDRPGVRDLLVVSFLLSLKRLGDDRWWHEED